MKRVLAALAALALSSQARAADWIHWRGPEQTGVARGQNLPESLDVDAMAPKGSLVWKKPVGGRSAPLVMDGRLYTINGYSPGELTEGERISCMDANTGEPIWEYRVNVYHADVVTSRLGWTTLTADPATKTIFAHTTGGELICLDRDGKRVWMRQLTEEFGRFTGYGGRIVSPVFDSGLVIVAIVNSSWGDQARGAGRFIAFDGKTGQVAWIGQPGLEFVNRSTYQSTPVVAVVGGQRLLISGGSDGALHAMKVRTGEKVWSYLFATGAINPSPVVDGDLVYGAHGEENPEGGAIGRVVCVDGSQVDPATKRPKLVWEYRRANRFGLSHPALADGRLYVPDDSAEMFCFNAKTGKLLWRKKYGTVSRGAPLIVDGRLYVFDVNAKLTVFKLDGDKKPADADTDEVTFRVPKGVTGFNETNGTPIAVNGRLYFTTTFDTYCLGGDKPVTESPAKPEKAETPFDPAAKPAALRLSPYEIHAKPGEAVAVTVKFVDANGRDLPAPADAKPEWSLPTPPVPKGATAGPPALKGELKPDGVTATVTLDKVPGQQGYVEVKAGGLTALGRVRVVPQIPYANDFEKVPVGAAPGGWINAQGKFVVKQLPDGGKVLSKVNTLAPAPISRANAYFTVPGSTGYTIEADLYATEVRDKLPDMGVVANRYTLVVDGKKDPATGKRTVRLTSWEARPRVNQVISYDWQKDTWYRAKLTVEVGDKTALVKGKVWPRGEAEPAAWTVEFEDPSPNREGAAALYGYVSNVEDGGGPGSEIYYDNLSVKPNQPAKK